MKFAAFFTLALILGGRVALAEASSPRLGASVEVASGKVAAKPAEKPKAGWQNESTLGITVNGGNSDSASYLFRQSSGYNWTWDSARLRGHYFLGRASGAESAKNWDVSGRYEHFVSLDLGLFAQNTWEGNPFAAVQVRTNIDLGGTYFLFGNKDSGAYLSSELGYRYQYEQRVPTEDPRFLRSHLARIFFEGRKPLTDGVWVQAWVEFLPNFTASQNYFFNFEPSLGVMLASSVSLKLGILGNYRGQPPAGKQNFDYIYTTSLVAAY